jgi:predicted TIM-barrel fold metal-dependent hydrolase
MWTIMVHLFNIQQNAGTQAGVAMAALVIAAVPTFLVFLFCQNVILRGIILKGEGIAHAMVGSPEAAFNQDCLAANRLLVKRLAGSTALHPVLALDPTRGDWHDILSLGRDEGIAAIRLFPAYHGYALRDDACDRLMAVARERDLPVALPLRMEDRRQQHWMDTAEDIPPRDVGELVGRFPEVKFIVLNGIGDPVDWATFRDAQVLIDISRLSHLRLRPPPRDVSIPALIDHFGADKLAFGTGIPISYPDPALLKVDILEADEGVKEQLRWRNAAQMLRLGV